MILFLRLITLAVGLRLSFLVLYLKQVNKAQNAQKGLNPSRSKDAKGMSMPHGQCNWLLDLLILMLPFSWLSYQYKRILVIVEVYVGWK